MAGAKRKTRPTGIKRVDLAHAEPASSAIARDINRDVVLELIRKGQPISRADITRKSGLQPSTVSAIVTQLTKEGWITEGSAVEVPRGRRPRHLTLNTGMFIAVADVRPAQATLAIVDLNARLLARQTVVTSKDPARGLKIISEALKTLIANTPNQSVEGIGISLPGRVDPETQQLIFAPNLPWTAADLKQEIQRETGFDVEMDNAANACMLSELWFGAMDGVRDAVLITISEGIGTAILANGNLVTGAHGLAGEFGHTRFIPEGLPCGCGRVGCWEMYASSRAALRYYAESGGSPACTNVMDLLSLAEDGNENALAALGRQAEYLADGLLNITAALSPEVIFLTGGLTLLWERFFPLIEARCKKDILSSRGPKLLVSANAEQARLRGAAALVLQRHTRSGSRKRAAKGNERVSARAK